MKEEIERHLRHDPEHVSQGSTKRLRGLSRPQYRLRVGDIRVFCDVTEQEVEILAIVPKSGAAAWLEETGEKE